VSAQVPQPAPVKVAAPDAYAQKLLGCPDVRFGDLGLNQSWASGVLMLSATNGSQSYNASQLVGG
jgi:hypothetical protein